nr:Rab family GTPase [Candidatus Sigynarchaeota archaeon]
MIDELSPATTSPPTHGFKIVCIGSNEVGMTTLMRRFCQDRFVDDGKPTLGTDLYLKEIRIGNQVVLLILWDPASQDSFMILRKYYFMYARCGLLLFDVNDPRSLAELEARRDEFLAACSQALCIMIGTKLDRLKGRGQVVEEAARMASKYGYELFLTSAKTGEGCHEALDAILRALLQKEIIDCRLSITR